MTGKTIGFVGGGRITRIFLGAWERQDTLPTGIIVSDCNTGSLEKLKSRFPSIITAPGNARAAAAQDIVVLAVHPPVMPDVANTIKGVLKPSAIVVSLAPKFTITKLTELLGGCQRIARMIPNAPSLIGAGYNPICLAPTLKAADRQTLKALFSPLGECPEVPEPRLEGYAILTGMGPTYLWFQLETLREIARMCGLTDAEITPALKRMVCGAARTLLDSGLPPQEVMDLIPVKPLAEDEPVIKQAYQSRLPALFAKIKP